MIKQIQQKFHQELKDLFPEKEINTFLYLLLEKIANLSRLDLVLFPDKKLDEKQISQFEKALHRLKNHEPIQYIIGETEFYGLKFIVNKNVLIPRPETEELVDWIIKDFQNFSDDFSILDIGTGSGCIAISLASKLKKADISALDISAKALKTAKENAEINKVKINFQQKNILGISANFNKKYEVIVSNPPYIRELEKKEMQSNVLAHEPHLALFVKDDDALLFYREILKFAEKNLTKNGKLYFEINEYLPEEMKELIREFKVKKYEFKKDIFGKYRMMKIQF